MDTDWGEKKFRSGRSKVTCEFTCMFWREQNPVEYFVEKASRYGYKLMNVSTNRVSYLGLDGKQYHMSFEKIDQKEIAREISVEAKKNV